jgi:hypothetical protein
LIDLINLVDRHKDFAEQARVSFAGPEPGLEPLIDLYKPWVPVFCVSHHAGRVEESEKVENLFNAGDVVIIIGFCT